MRTSKLHYLFSTLLVTLCMSAVSIPAHATSNSQEQTADSLKERLVLMPLRLDEEDKNLTGSMETALVEGLQKKYTVYFGEIVSKKAHEIFLKESRAKNKTECDEIKCMQKIAEAFQAELLATSNVTQRDGGYFLALTIQNIFDNKVVYSKSIPCDGCTSFQAVEKMKELSAGIRISKPHLPLELSKQSQVAVTDVHTEIQKNNSSEIQKKGLAKGIDKNNTLTPEQKFSAMLKLANSGDDDAQDYVGYYFENAKGVEKDEKKALGYYLKSSAQGNGSALYSLGYFNFNGIAGLKKNTPKSTEYLIKSAAAGYWKAQYLLGARYEKGVLGIKKNEVKAFELYGKAIEGFKKYADEGNDDSQYFLGYMYLNGQGTPKNDLKASEWFLKSAAQGNLDAQVNIGYAYEIGQGVVVDKVLAYAWYNLAASQGNATGIKDRDNLEKKLSATENLEAQRLSSNWKKGQIIFREGKH
jgi:TPR repeat protein